MYYVPYHLIYLPYQTKDLIELKIHDTDIRDTAKQAKTIDSFKDTWYTLT